MAGKGVKDEINIIGEKVPCRDSERRIYQAINLLIKLVQTKPDKLKDQPAQVQSKLVPIRSQSRQR